MGKLRDLNNMTFGRLLVVERTGSNKYNQALWRCLCECGNMVDVIGNSLQSGHTQSCGCLHKEMLVKRCYKSLVGQKFGRLAVIKETGRDKHGKVLWHCLCDCGNETTVIGGDLVQGKTTSCGCFSKENRSGENSHLWKGGTTPLNKAVRTCTRYREWRTLIFQRDDFTCSHCHVRGGKLHAHHINRFSKIIEENHITTLEDAIGCTTLWDIDNGVTLCKKCHKKEHSKEIV